MAKHKRPLKKSILTGVIIFILLLCVVLSVVQYNSYKTMLYSHYKSQITGILRFAELEIDVNDLARCIETGVKTDKYLETQKSLDKIKESLNVHFIYIVVPLNTEPMNNMKNVIAGATQYEYEYEADEIVQLNELTGDSYSPETARKYLDAYQSGELSFFEASSQWGCDFTGLLPLLDAGGKPVAALCVDVDVAEINGKLRNNIVEGNILILLLGMLFVGAFYVWVERKVSDPIEQLEASVVEFASKCRDQKDPEALNIDVPVIRTHNEVETLADAVSRMGSAIRDYVQNIASTERELERVTLLANKDNLTGVRNQNAYDTYMAELQSKIAEGDQEPFALLLADLNHLEKVNNTCGHEKGDQYIQKTCRVICEVFSHSPVFRISGDEFAVVLTGQDYQERNALLRWARTTFRDIEQDETLPLWERCSAAIGVAECEPGTDLTFEGITERVMESMVQEKERMQNI
ncbi:MAG: GGDEF domain-containing protein [Clostridia bacterium]|nr:GGDEF domain-containing protein [Clostridia bacterium]